jgi:hypothetical protein
MEIPTDEAFTMDWDWFAADEDGRVGHFTTAGMRPLPESLRGSRETLDLLSEYFEKRAAIRGGAVLTPGLEKERGAFNRPINWSSFLEMAVRGLYSYNTELIYGPEAHYYLVAKPDRPISVHDLPVEIRGALERTILPISFAVAARIPESQTV